RWTSLHESTSVCPPLLISSHLSPMHRLYHLHILHYHFALCTFQRHTHTHKHKITILHYPSSQAQAQEHYIFLHYPHQQHKITFLTFLLDTDTVKIIALCTIGSDPFLCLETLCVNMFSLCVCICDLCMHVGEVYKCICVFVYVYKLLDDLNFPLD